MTILRRLLFLFFLLMPCLPATANQLPGLGSPAASLFSSQQRVAMGHAWLRQLRSRVSILHDPFIQSYAEHIIWQLLGYSGLKNTNIDLVIINTSAINAFAVPGGVIGLNAGTLMQADNEDEIAAVLAHELAHLSQHHFEQRLYRSKHTSRSFLLAMLASIALAASGMPNAGFAGLAASQAAMIQSRLAYSRQQEAEADRIGMQTLDAAGFNPNAMPAFFEKLLRMSRFNGQPLEFLMNHPITESRIADTRARASKLPPHAYHTSLKFLLMRARLKARFYHDPDQAIAYFSNLYTNGNNQQQLAAGYGLAIALMRKEQTQKATKLLQQLLEIVPDNWWFKAGLAESAMKANDFQKANQQLKKLLNLFPGNYAISVLYAKSLIRSEQPSKVKAVLQPLRQERPDDPLLWRLAAKAFGAMNQPARAHLARGKHLFLNGHIDKGIQQLEYALNKSKDQFALHSRINAAITQMKRAKHQPF